VREVLGFYVVPAALGVVLASVADVGADFEANVWKPAQAVLDGANPYPPPEIEAIVGQRTFVYPPVLLWLDVPLSVFGHDVAQILFTMLSVAAVFASLWILDVTDRRVFACVLLSFPTLQALVFGNPTILLLPILALAWTQRDRPVTAGVAVGLIVALKPLLFPLGLWLLFQRRFKALAVAIAFAVTALAATWAAISFDGLADYPEVVRLIGETSAGPRGYSVSTLLHELGTSRALGRAVQTVIAVTMLAAVPFVARARDGDIRSLALTLAAALVLSPVVWLHYLALLFVPLAVVRRSSDRAWSASRLVWIALFMPASADYVIHSEGQVYRSFGHIPSPPRVAVALAFIAAVVAATFTATRGARTRSS
jgi:hypothetical protein